jgi:hypothetical protein
VQVDGRFDTGGCIPPILGRRGDFRGECGFRVVIKLIAGWIFEHRPLLKSVTIVNTARELLQEYAKNETPGQPNVMLQEYIPGGPEYVWMFNGCFTDSSECLSVSWARKYGRHPRLRAERHWASASRTRQSGRC